MSKKEIITITQELYDELLKRSDWLMYLEGAGVDNWPGIDEAYEMKREAEGGLKE